MNKNCPNCAAPYEFSLNKCPYCGTSYFDLTSIDFENNEPVWLKMNFLNCIITMKVIPKLESIDFSSETVYAYGGKHGEKLAQFRGENACNPCISFTGVPFDYNNQKVLMTCTVEDKA